MSKEETIVLKGKVVEVLPNTTFRVETEQGAKIFCHISGKMRKNHITILLNDTVDVDVSPYDLSKGRITFRHK